VYNLEIELNELDVYPCRFGEVRVTLGFTAPFAILDAVERVGALDPLPAAVAGKRAETVNPMAED
jgi:hypothetical protein